MKLDEAMARTMTPAERAILEEWAAREGPLAEACRAALRDLDALRASQTDVIDASPLRRQTQEIRRFSEELEAEVAKADWSMRALTRCAELSHLFLNHKITFDEYYAESNRLTRDIMTADAAANPPPSDAPHPLGPSQCVDCPDCSGRGWRYAGDDHEDCTTCNGSGLRQ